MSLQAVRDFLNRVVEDEQLLKDLTLALEAEDDRTAVAKLANQRGFCFTPEELWTEVQNLQAEYVRQANAAVADLSDEELEEVAGGATAMMPLLLSGMMLGGATIMAPKGFVPLMQSASGVPPSQQPKW
ncbi:MAG: Nif11-like leader peptide family natural product precursor [Thermostichus sp. BF3_bins_97]